MGETPNIGPKGALVHDKDAQGITSTSATPKRALDVNIAASDVAMGGGTQYTEGDTDASITGTAIMFESNTGTNALSVVNTTTPLPVQGPTASGAAATGNPNQIAGQIKTGLTGAGNVAPLVTAPDGDLIIHQQTGSIALVDDVSNTIRIPVNETDQGFFTYPVFPWWFDGTTWDRARGSSADGLLVNLGANNDVTVTGTVTADTELPAAAALADNTANPTVPAVGSFLMGFDGTNWDRVRVGTPSIDGVAAASFPSLLALSVGYAFDGSDFDRIRLEGSLLGLTVGGSVAHDAADAGNPISQGLNARTTNPTAVADGDRVRAIGDDLGRPVVVLNQVRDLVTTATTTISSTSETTILAAAASTFHDLTLLVITNTSQSSVTIDIKDTTGGSTVMSIGLAPKGGAVIPFQVPFKQTTVNTNWTATLSAAVTDVRFFVQACKNV